LLVCVWCIFFTLIADESILQALQEQLVIELGPTSQNILTLLVQSPKSDAEHLHEAMEVSGSSLKYMS
jgi:hypothetical protein